MGQGMPPFIVASSRAGATMMVNTILAEFGQKRHGLAI